MKKSLLKKLSIGIASIALIAPLELGGIQSTNVHANTRWASYTRHSINDVPLTQYTMSEIGRMELPQLKRSIKYNKRQLRKYGKKHNRETIFLNKFLSAENTRLKELNKLYKFNHKFNHSGKPSKTARTKKYKAKRDRKVAQYKHKQVNRYNNKFRKINRHKKVRHGQQIIKSRFKRSNNKQALKRSGFFDAHAFGGNFIFNRYAPNDKRAVVPYGVAVNNWCKGNFMQSNPVAYNYVPKLHGWKIVK